MKRIITLLFFFVFVSASAQIYKGEVIGLDTLTTAERDLLTVPADRAYIIFNETTGQFESNAGGAGWQSLAASGGGSLTAADIDTWAELNAIVADSVLATRTYVDDRSLTDGDKGDVVVSSGGSIWGLDENSVGVFELQGDTPTPTAGHLVGVASNQSTLEFIDPSTIGTIGGSITDNQIAVGATTANDIEGSAGLTYDGTVLDANAMRANLIYLDDVTRRWLITSNTGGTDAISIAYESGTGTNIYNELYSFNETGTPSEPNDIIDKAYADTNYAPDGTGTDDQTAAEVSYDNTSSGLSASTVQAGIDENAVNISQNATDISDNAASLSGYGITQDSIVQALGTVGSTPMEIFNYSANQTAIQAHLADNAIVRLDDATLTIPNDSIPTTGQSIKVAISSASTGAVNVAKGSGLTIAGYTDGITLDSYPAGVTLMKTGLGSVDVIDYFGSISDYILSNNVYLNRIASADGSDVNTTTNWGNGNGTFAVETTEVRTGTYSLEIVNDAAGTGSEYVQFFLEQYGQAVGNGDVIRVTYWAKSNDSNVSISTRWDGVDGTSYSTLTSSWNQFTRDHTDNGTGLALRFYLNDLDGDASNTVWIDDITIEINP